MSDPCLIPCLLNAVPQALSTFGIIATDSTYELMLPVFGTFTALALAVTAYTGRWGAEKVYMGCMGRM